MSAGPRPGAGMPLLGEAGTVASTVPPGARVQHPGMLALAMVLAFFEGIDLGSMGVTLSRLSKVLNLNHADAGLCASASLVGLVISATVGGRLADRIGARPVAVGSILFLGIFSIATAFTWDFASLIVARFLTGLGMGALYPILLTAGRNAAAPAFRTTAISMVIACGPLGALGAAVVSLHPDWRWVFIFGGAGPLLALPVLYAVMPRQSDAATRPKAKSNLAATLFGSGLAFGTLMMWVTMFLTSLSVQLFVNWLPSLLVLQGFSERHSRVASMFYFAGSIAGNLAAGHLMSRIGARSAAMLGYGGAAICAIALALISPGQVTFAVILATAIFLAGAQLVGMALVPGFYPPEAQTTGTGTVVSIARCGAITGPIAAGALLQAGVGVDTVFMLLAPVFLLALSFSLIFQLLRARQLRDRGGSAEDIRHA